MTGISFLWQWVRHPFKTLNQPTPPPTYMSWGLLLLYSMMLNMPFNIWILLPLNGLLITGLIGGHAIAVDITAQIMSKKGNSLRLFHWFVLSWTPTLIGSMLKGGHFFKAKWLLLHPMLSFGLFCWVVSLQIGIIRHLYDVDTRQSIWIYLLPLIVPIGLVGLIGLISSVYGIFFLRSFYANWSWI